MAGSISLEELVALNDEIAGLVRSGVPLELGLAGWGRGLSGKLGRIVRRLGESAARGNSLVQSLDESGANFPPVYRAIVTAGIRSGRLPAALESLATSARNLREVRRAVGLAMLYPLVLILLSYFALWLLLVQILPALFLLYDGDPPAFWAAVAEFGQTANWQVPIPLSNRAIAAGWIPPIVLLLIVFAWWLMTRRALVLLAGSPGRWIERVPLAGRTMRDARLASFAEILGLLVEHDVPLNEALVLAAECTGNRRLVRTAGQAADSLAQGSSPSIDRLPGFPPLLAWIVSAGAHKQTLVSLARHVADTYRRRMVRESRWLKDYLPMLLVVLVGGGLVTLLGVTTFLPFSELMQNLSEDVNQSMRVSP